MTSAEGMFFSPRFLRPILVSDTLLVSPFDQSIKKHLFWNRGKSLKKKLREKYR